MEAVRDALHRIARHYARTAGVHLAPAWTAKASRQQFLTHARSPSARATRPGGHIALSGLLAEQAETVTAAYRPWFDIGIAATRDGWALLTGARRAN